MKKTSQITGNIPKQVHVVDMHYRKTNGTDAQENRKKWILDIGSGGAPDPRANVFLEPYLEENSHRLGSKVVILSGFIIGDWHHLPFKDGTIDFVYATSVIEHVKNPMACFRETLRVLKNPHCYEITCPTAEYEVLGYFLFKDGLNPTHHWIFTKEGIHPLSYLNRIKLSFRQRLLRRLPIKIKLAVYTTLYGVIAEHVLQMFGIETRMQHLNIADYFDVDTLQSKKDDT